LNNDGNDELSHTQKRPIIVDDIATSNEDDNVSSTIRSPIHMEIENIWPGNETFTGRRPISPPIPLINDDIDGYLVRPDRPLDETLDLAIASVTKSKDFIQRARDDASSRFNKEINFNEISKIVQVRN
jgi:hypothetical protein